MFAELKAAAERLHTAMVEAETGLNAYWAIDIRGLRLDVGTPYDHRSLLLAWDQVENAAYLGMLMRNAETRLLPERKPTNETYNGRLRNNGAR